jgi:hypothetical protein
MRATLDPSAQALQAGSPLTTIESDALTPVILAVAGSGETA